MTDLIQSEMEIDLRPDNEVVRPEFAFNTGAELAAQQEAEIDLFCVIVHDQDRYMARKWLISEKWDIPVRSIC
jgi:hypothetical protein